MQLVRLEHKIFHRILVFGNKWIRISKQFIGRLGALGFLLISQWINLCQKELWESILGQNRADFFLGCCEFFVFNI